MTEDDKVKKINEDEFLKEKELADLLKLHVNTIRLWRIHGKGPAFVKIDDRGTVRHRRSVIAAWLDDRTRLATDGSKFLNNIAARSVA